MMLLLSRDLHLYSIYDFVTVFAYAKYAFNVNCLSILTPAG